MILIWISRGNTRPNGLFWGSTNPRQSMMTAPSMEWDLSTLVYLIHGFLEPITHSRQELGSHPKKCTHGGHPLESPLVIKLPHVMSLHQSAPLMESVNHDAHSVWAHSSLISCPVQDGQLAPVDCTVLYSDCCSLRFVKDSSSSANGPWVFSCDVPTLHPRGTKSLGQNVAMGSPDRPETGPWGASPPYGWWVSSLSFFGVWVPFPYIFFRFLIAVFKGFDFLRTVLWPVHLCRCPRRARLNWAARFWVPTCLC